jgi:hypothetical protein
MTFALLLAGASALAQSESVLIPAKDYQKLLDELEAAKKAKAVAKPVSPSVCHIECELKRTKERPLAALNLTFQFRTTQPKSVVLLGGQRAFAVKASLDGGGPPALEPTTDGLVALIESAGEHSLTLSLETTITSRGTKGDLGFDVGLPRAAITTLTLANPGADVKSLNVGTRWLDAASKPGELKIAPIEPGKLAKSYPLGPTDVLDLSWEASKTAPPPSDPTMDVDVTVRVDDARVDTTATLKLRGPAKEWNFVLPLGAELTGTDAIIVRPADAKKRDWKVTLPAATTEATLIATLRQPRSEPKEAKSFSVGPFLATGNVRQSGTVKLFAPITLRLIPRPTAEVRRVETPIAAANENLVAAFRYSLPAIADRKPAALLDFDVRPASGFVVASPHHKLALTPLGWKLRSEYRIAPVRTAIEQLSLELPVGWQNPTLTPLDLVEEVHSSGDANGPNTLLVRLASPQREPFELVLEARWPLPAEAREIAIPLPRIPAAREREAQVTVTVPESLELTGSAREWDAGKLAAAASELKRIKSSSLGGGFDGGVARLDLAWQPFHAKLLADVRADLAISERQITVSQTIKLNFPEGAVKSVRLTGPTTAVGFRANPPLETLGSGEWNFTPPTGAKEATLAISYAVPVKLTEAGPQRLPASLVWPEATSADTTVRVWSTSATRRVAAFEGPWREGAPEPSAERDSLPSLTLGGHGVNLPLTLNLEDASPAGSIIVDRAVYQWWMNESASVQGRARFLLRRWPASLEIDLSGTSGLSVFIDKARVEPTAHRGDAIRVSLPEAKPTRSTLLLDLRFTGPASAPWSETRLDPPRLHGAVFRSSAWWQIAPPPGSLPLAFGGNLDPDPGWHWAGFGFAPAAGQSSEDLDRWLSDGVSSDGDPQPGDAAVTARQALPAPVRVVRLPKLLGILLGAGIVLALGALMIQLRGSWRAIAFGLLAASLAFAAVLMPQPMSQFMLAFQPGLALLAISLGGLALLRRRRQQYEAQNATFTRSPTPTVNGVPSSATVNHSSRISRSGTAAAAGSP